MLSEYSVRGLVVENYRTDLPIRKGLSSSAAACVLTARAFNRLYDLKLTVQDEMECAYLGGDRDTLEMWTDGSGLRVRRWSHPHGARP